jgi:septal ring factor EnvC (AmiA/AmiB activator)
MFSMDVHDGGAPVAILVSVLAFFLAIFAVWFAASANGIAERTSQNLMKAQIKIFRNAMDEQNKATADLAKRVLTLEKAIRGLRNIRDQDAKLLSSLEQGSPEMRNPLGEGRKRDVA